MIVHNTSSNVRIFSAKGKSVYIFPGINGELPDTLAEDSAFQGQKEAGVMVVLPTPKECKRDLTRENMKPDAAVKVPDNDVVEAFLAMNENKAIRSINDLTKEATLKALRARETRGSVIASIEKQLEVIGSLNIQKA